jgi:hypothetical protein
LPLIRLSRIPRGPKGERRSADVGARAVVIAEIAIGEIEDAHARIRRARIRPWWRLGACAVARAGSRAGAEAQGNRAKAAKACWGWLYAADNLNFGPQTLASR